MSITEQMTVRELYREADRSLAFEWLSGFTYPWEALDGIKAFLLSLGKTLSLDEYDLVGEDVWIAKSAKIAPSASIAGPCIICEGAEVRPSAFIRGSALVGRNAVVGNSTELKNCILFDNVQVPHFNYVGDSILGYKSHLGAGAVTSNVKSDKTPVAVHCGGETVETGRKKFGAMLGDYVEVGCNSVLNPGTVIGRNSNVYPLSPVRGFGPANSIFKSQNNIVIKRM